MCTYTFAASTMPPLQILGLNDGKVSVEMTLIAKKTPSTPLLPHPDKESSDNNDLFDY